MLTEKDLLDAAGPTIFERGVDYVRYVRGLQVRDGQATASIQAKRVYTVRLAWIDDILEGECSCPHNSEGNFCKHLVAVGLASLGAEAGPLVEDDEAELVAYVDGLDRAALVDLVRELIAQDQAALRLVQLRAVAAGSAAVDPDELERGCPRRYREASSTIATPSMPRARCRPYSTTSKRCSTPARPTRCAQRRSVPLRDCARCYSTRTIRLVC